MPLFKACAKHPGCFVFCSLFNVSRGKTDSPTAQTLKIFQLLEEKSVSVQCRHQNDQKHVGIGNYSCVSKKNSNQSTIQVFFEFVSCFQNVHSAKQKGQQGDYNHLKPINFIENGLEKGYNSHVELSIKSLVGSPIIIVYCTRFKPLISIMGLLTVELRPGQFNQIYRISIIQSQSPISQNSRVIIS